MTDLLQPGPIALVSGMLLAALLALAAGLLLHGAITKRAQRGLKGRTQEASVPEQTGPVSPVGSQSVLVYVNGGWQPALLIERAVSGAYVVYIPNAPDARSGTIYVVESFQVTPLNMPVQKMQDTIQHFGKGLSTYAGKLFENG